MGHGNKWVLVSPVRLGWDVVGGLDLLEDC